MIPFAQSVEQISEENNQSIHTTLTQLKIAATIVNNEEMLAYIETYKQTDYPNSTNEYLYPTLLAQAKAHARKMKAPVVIYKNSFDVNVFLTFQTYNALELNHPIKTYISFV